MDIYHNSDCDYCGNGPDGSAEDEIAYRLDRAATAMAGAMDAIDGVLADVLEAEEVGDRRALMRAVDGLMELYLEVGHEVRNLNAAARGYGDPNVRPEDVP